MQPREQREAAAERVVPEEELEHGGLLVPPGPPVRVRHGELVQVGEQRGDPLPNRALHGRARVAGRRRHVGFFFTGELWDFEFLMRERK